MPMDNIDMTKTVDSNGKVYTETINKFSSDGQVSIYIDLRAFNTYPAMTLGLNDIVIKVQNDAKKYYEEMPHNYN